MDENALGMMLGMLAIALTWVAALAAFCGLGLSLLRWMGLERDGSEGLFAAVWIGWALALGALQVWHLFRPVDAWGRALVVIIGWVGLAWNLRSLWAQLRPVLRHVLPFAAAAILLGLWMANRAMAPAMFSDAGLYHLGTVRWLSAYPIVPGLGNLHWRLAANSSYFLYMAAMDFGPWSHRAQHVAAYLLLITLGLQIGWSAYAVLLRRRAVLAHDLFRLVLLPAVAGKMWGGVHEGEPDLAVWVLGVVIIDKLIGLTGDAPRGRRAWSDVLMVVIASSAAVTVKLSAGVLGIAASGIAMAWATRSVGTPMSGRLSSASFKALTLPGFLVAIWVLRGLVLSGYPAFPSTVGGLAVDWRVPSDIARSEARWIMSWARLPGQNPDVVLQDWAWLQPWAERVADVASFDLLAPLGIAAVCLIVAGIRRRRWDAEALVLAAISMALAGSLAFWFATAPEPRLAGATAWLLAASSLLLAAGRWGVQRTRQLARCLFLVVLVAAVAPHLTSAKRIPPGPETGFYALAQPGLVEVSLPTGLTVFRPAAGDECWDTSLLCTPYPSTALRLRVAGELGSGFSLPP